MLVWNDGSITCEKIGPHCILVERLLLFELWTMMSYCEKFAKFLAILGPKTLILMPNLKQIVSCFQQLVFFTISYPRQ